MKLPSTNYTKQVNGYFRKIIQKEILSFTVLPSLCLQHGMMAGAPAGTM